MRKEFDDKKIYKLITVFLIVALSFEILFELISYRTFFEYTDTLQRGVSVAKVEGEIGRLDELLTCNAKLAAYSGDLDYKRIYDENVGKLDSSINTLLSLTPVAIDKAEQEKIDNANKKLVPAEERSFEFTANGLRKEAIAELTSDEYKLNKEIYAQASKKAQEAIDRHIAEKVSVEKTQTERIIISRMLILALIIIVFFVVTQMIKRSNAAVVQLNMETIKSKDHVNRLNVDLTIEQKKYLDANDKLIESNRQLGVVARDLEMRFEERTRELRLTVDTISTAIVTIRTDGTMVLPLSKPTIKMFGNAKDGDFVWSHLFLGDSKLEKAFKDNLSEILENTEFIDAYIAQLPNQFKRDDRDYSIVYQPMIAEDNLQYLVACIDDITLKLQNESAERESKELASVITQLLHDRPSFVNFVDESKRLVREILVAHEKKDMNVLRHRVHTLKGQCATIGFSKTADICNELEDKWAAGVGDWGGYPTKIEESLISSLLKIQPFMGDSRLKSGIQVFENDIDSIIYLLEKSEDKKIIIDEIKKWSRPRILGSLNRLRDAGLRSAGMLGKAILIEIDDSGLREPRINLKPLFSELVHLVNNAVDHGIELPNVRAAANKPEAGRIKISTSLNSEGNLNIIVSDDGAGVDLIALRSVAEAKGLRCDTDEELLSTMLLDGVSTLKKATQWSGRGRGTNAVKQCVDDLGGSIDLKSIRGQGTTITLTIPVGNRTAV